jgi:organic hydroperoxide reductase OsmC/OhrA
MSKEHKYEITTEWTGNRGSGTVSYQGYDRSYTLSQEGKPVIHGSSDPAFRGDKSKHNPEDMLVASISSCHMLWYLHLCAEAGVVVSDYIDNAQGIMVETANGGGRFKEVVLNPVVTVLGADMVSKASELHHKANELCFIANSVNFQVLHVAKIKYQETDQL